MVAYSFQRRFVAPICVGLGRPFPNSFGVTPPGIFPKRQTIRAVGKKRHARAGEMVQLYFGLRTKSCFQIGTARCAGVKSILLRLEDRIIVLGWDRPRPEKRLSSIEECDEFARADGFRDFDEMRRFWREHHPGVRHFRGVVIFWEPIT